MEEIIQFFPQNLNSFLPKFFWVAFVLIIGWFVAKWTGELLAAFLRRIKLDRVFKRMGWDEALAKIDTKFNIANFFGEIIRWFFVALLLLFFSGLLGLSQLSLILEKIIGYYPNIFIAAVIFLAAVFLADCSKKIVVGTLDKEKITYSDFLGKIIRWLIWTLAILAIFYQLKIVPTLILIIFIGIVGILVLSVGIAFGFGGKDLAAKILKELEERFK